MSYKRQLNYLDLILKNKAVPHAFLFHGPDVSAQKEIAKSMLARLNDNDEAQSIVAETHPDTLFVEKQEGKKETGIAQIRALKDFVSKTPLSLKTKGVFVVGAQSLNEESWNALLKTLEEPTADTVIFLISSGLSSIPKTIISRVLMLSFLPDADNFKPSTAENDDIILNKLAGLAGLSVAERFDLAEKLALAENKLEILDAWMLLWRSELLLHQDISSSSKMKAIAKARNILSATNANPRLILENLFLNT